MLIKVTIILIIVLLLLGAGLLRRKKKPKLKLIKQDELPIDLTRIEAGPVIIDAGNEQRFFAVSHKELGMFGPAKWLNEGL